MAATAPSPIHVGVLMLGHEGVQMLDFSGIDVLGCMTPEYIGSLDEFAQPEIRAAAVPFVIHWISEGGPSKGAMTTGSTAVKISNTFEDCPALDILMIPGPEIKFRMSDSEYKFIHKQLGSLTALMSVCTGIQGILQAGLAEGKTVSCPRVLIPMLQAQYPKTTFAERRWEKDTIQAPGTASKHPALASFNREKNGIELWTSGGVMNGIDMMANFLLTKFPGPVSQFAVGLCDAPCRPQEYS